MTGNLWVGTGTGQLNGTLELLGKCLPGCFVVGKDTKAGKVQVQLFLQSCGLTHQC